MYKFATLDPRPTGTEANEQIFTDADGGVYGVEVTIPALAARCTLGNLDPQHTGGQNVAACVAALDCPLPPDGATLVTVRPDADALLTMAVLTLRQDGRHLADDRKVHLIGAADSAPNGPWVQNYTPPMEFAQVNAVAMNHRIPLAERITMLIDWLEGFGQLPEVSPVDTSAIDVHVSTCGRYAVARADGPAGRGACGAGYQQAPVVIAVNHAFQLGGGEPHLKYTVARWNTTVDMDWAGMLTELQALEPGWGGSSSICGSPQGIGSTLTLEQVEKIVARHL